MAERMGASQVAFAQMEAEGNRPRIGTLKNIAGALGVEWEQLRE